MRIFILTLSLLISSAQAATETDHALIWNRYEAWRHSQKPEDLDALLLASSAIVEPIAERFSAGFSSTSPEEFAQEAYIRLARIVQKRVFSHPKDNLPLYLARITRNCAISLIRQESKHQKRFGFELQEGQFSQASREPSPEEQVQQRLLLEKILRIRDRVLPPEYRSMLNSLLEGKSTYEELSKEHGIPMGTVMSRIFRTRTIVRRNLAVGSSVF